MSELIDQLPCAALTTDADGKILVSNRELISLVGFESEAALPRQVDDLLPPAGRIFLQTHLWPLLRREGRVREAALSLLSPSGERVPVLLNCSRSAPVNGAPRFVWVFFAAVERSRFELELVDARKRAEVAAAQAESATVFINKIANAMPGMVAYFDKNLHCQFANDVYLQWFGKSPQQMIGMSLRALLGEALFAANEPSVRGALAGTRQAFQRSLVKPDGSLGHTLAQYIPDLREGKVQGFCVSESDVTQLKNAEIELEMAASVFANTLDGIMIADVNGIIVSVNPAFTQITGYAAAEAVGQRVNLLSSTRNDTGFAAAMAHDLVQHQRWEGESWARRQDGSVFRQWQRVTTTLAANAQRYVFVFNDVTERWHHEERTRKLALYDALTDLPNRTLLLERLGQLIASTAREERKIAVLFLDLDGFKAVNDTLGHEVGDEVLRAVAGRLVGLVRQTDTVARLGGDEFVVLLDNPASLEEVQRIAGLLVTSVNEPIVRGDVQAQIGASIGIALHPLDGRTPTELLKAADVAMYEAKAAGKNTFRSSKSSLARFPGGIA
ncbi:MAG: diguanylate cyclase [Archangium sp.]|nr:diguanylate cyclase [Archangium sp.]